MAEIGIDISKHKSKDLKEFAGREMDYVITVCGDRPGTCPFFAGGKEYIHQSFKDPSAFNGTGEDKIKHFRSVRDELKKWSDDFYINNFEDENRL